MIDFSEIHDDGEDWELFARDFLQEIGFYIDQSPDRGPDGGKDLVVTEELHGNLGNYKFRWLVSCKHYAKSKKSVQEKDELNIQERIDSFNCDGFIGFYSTIVSSGLNTRLINLRHSNRIKDYKIFDNKLIESYLLRIGYSRLMMRYMPKNYDIVRPLRLIVDQYLPLNCKNCGEDLLGLINDEPYSGIVAFLNDRTNEEHVLIEDVYWCCKGNCDRVLKAAVEQNKRTTGWEDIGDLIIPAYYLKWLFGHMNILRSGDRRYSDDAFENLKYFIVAISQRVLREMTENESKRVVQVLSTQGL